MGDWKLSGVRAKVFRFSALKGRDNRRGTRLLYINDPQDEPWNGDRFPGKKNYLVTRYLEVLGGCPRTVFLRVFVIISY